MLSYLGRSRVSGAVRGVQPAGGHHRPDFMDIWERGKREQQRDINLIQFYYQTFNQEGQEDMRRQIDRDDSLPNIHYTMWCNKNRLLSPAMPLAITCVEDLWKFLKSFNVFSLCQWEFSSHTFGRLVDPLKEHAGISRALEIKSLWVVDWMGGG